MNIVYITLQQLQENNYYGVSNNIEIAKGKYKLGRNFRKIKRRVLYFLLK